MSDLPLKKYRSRSPENPYLKEDWTTTALQPEKPISQGIWMGNAENVTWRELKEKIKAERGAKCECCGSLRKLDLHHITSRKNKGKDVEDNLQLLCRACHAKTPSFGRR
jgi:5-methylcytosine-specific restriction endonuclease McrA